MKKPPHEDWQLVLALGGPEKLAATLGFTESSAVQRVRNWKVRGIPFRVRVENKALFGRAARRVAKAAA